MAETRIRDDVPTEIIPKLTPPPAAAGLHNPCVDVALAYVDRHGTIVKNVNPLAAFSNQFDVRVVSRPHLAVLSY